ncbi:unnamed protein product, partial [marine sediment metagenome]
LRERVRFLKNHQGASGILGKGTLSRLRRLPFTFEK